MPARLGAVFALRASLSARLRRHTDRRGAGRCSSAPCSPGCSAPRSARESPMPRAAPSPPSRGSVRPLNANVHFHSLVLDGVFSPPAPGAAPVLNPLPAPTNEEIAHILEQIHVRVTRLRRRCGHLLEDMSAERGAGLATDHPGASFPSGPRADQP